MHKISPTIYVCVSFREFNGDENSKIQDQFLNSLSKQSYKNWVISVTQFNEKTVLKKVHSLNIPHSTFESPAVDFRYSHSESLLNTISQLPPTPSIVLWTTGDVVFEPNFFQTIVDTYRPRAWGTSHPHKIYTSIDDYFNNASHTIDPNLGIDTIFFDGEVARQKKFANIVRSYPNTNWGYFEFFLTQLGNAFHATKINLYQKSVISKIQNVREHTTEYPLFFTESMNKNLKTYQRFIKKYRLENFSLEIFRLHLEYKPLLPIRHYIEFHQYYVLYLLKHSKYLNSLYSAFIIIRNAWTMAYDGLFKKEALKLIKQYYVATKKPLRVVLGAGKTKYPHWLSTNKDTLDLLKEKSWLDLFDPASIHALLAEHVWEHLTESQGQQAAKLCYKYLLPGGYLRIAVPDGNHPNEQYIQYVKPGGSGPGASDHKILYTHKSLSDLLIKCGFEIKLLEYFDDKHGFHESNWNKQNGFIMRSKKFDSRNVNGQLKYTSLIIDAHKP